MKPSTTWLTANTGYLAAVALAVYLDNVVLRSAVIGFTWLMLACYVVVLISPSASRHQRAVAMWVSIAFAIATLALLLAAEWYGTAAAWIASGMVLERIYRRSPPHAD